MTTTPDTSAPCTAGPIERFAPDCPCPKCEETRRYLHNKHFGPIENATHVPPQSAPDAHDIAAIKMTYAHDLAPTVRRSLAADIANYTRRAAADAFEQGVHAAAVAAYTSILDGKSVNEITDAIHALKRARGPGAPAKAELRCTCGETHQTLTAWRAQGLWTDDGTTHNLLDACARGTGGA